VSAKIHNDFVSALMRWPLPFKVSSTSKIFLLFNLKIVSLDVRAMHCGEFIKHLKLQKMNES
jgi:hypothetical protein